jgi:hypothetical protein
MSTKESVPFRWAVRNHAPDGYPCPFNGLQAPHGLCPVHDLHRVRIAQDYGEQGEPSA